MSESSEPLEICRSEMQSRYPRQTWICEWEGIISPRRGVFLVEAGHHLDAKQTAKKYLRDKVLHSLDFTFKVRVPSLLERAQLKFTPQLLCSGSGKVKAGHPASKGFAGSSSAGSTNKT